MSDFIKMQQQELAIITNNFSITGNFIKAKPYGSGHINDTYLVTTSAEKYILQRLNHNIFKNIGEMNRNIIKALKHLYSKQKTNNDHRFRDLEIILCNNGDNHYKDKDGNYWRMMNFVSGSTSFDVAEKPETAYEAAKALGYFQENLADLDPDDFYPVIKDFHNLEMRMNSFKDVLEENPQNRKQFATTEIEFVKSHEHLSDSLKELLEGNKLPIRVTHNDTKINNVLLDRKTLKGIAVKDVLTETEKAHLVFGGKIMTFMIGLRFLTDFLNGDVYFNTTRKNHNLDRCRTQFKLLLEIEKQEEVLNQIIKALL
ncbi:MAG: hypothetical protein B6I19_01690 [Bacteroidetes bacterium 4572_114]|nr:MAG: hypothetical protein B6I19_01690 [Bacteroidetes bacterium 4572_114]